MELRNSSSRLRLEKYSMESFPSSRYSKDLALGKSNSNFKLYPSKVFSSVSSKEKEKNINIENSEDKSEEDEENEEQSEKRTNSKRRTKNDEQERKFECKLCQKSYLSYPALYTHCKIKHQTNNTSGNKRGRPKKEQNENGLEKSRYNPINLTFFSKEERTGVTEPKNEINQCIVKTFNELYSKENKKINDMRNMKFYSSVEKHPFLSKFKNDNHDIYRNIIDEYQKIDVVLIDYLNKMSMFCNPEYYIKLIKFVTLFREHVNQFYGKKNNTDKEYTEINDAENFPDSANEFLIHFLHSGEKENDFGFNKEESIDLTQNLCYWLFENNYTCSKLSIIT